MLTRLDQRPAPGRTGLRRAAILGSLLLALVLASSPAAAPAATTATAAPGSTTGAPLASRPAPPSADRVVAVTSQRRGVRRRGGRVRLAWPLRRSARPPRQRLARLLARQVGPVPERRLSRARRMQRRGGASAAALPQVVRFGAGDGARLALVRSFDIPRGDPAYARLANYSWTYDNALAALAFVASGDRAQATQLLDQLAALQRADGAIEFAFDVSSGAAAPQVRAGTLAWVGLAAAAYRRRYDDKRYDALLGGLVNRLLELRDASGLVRGGPDVPWVSTQHNILTVGLLRDLRLALSTRGGTIGGRTTSQYLALHQELGTAVSTRLLVQQGALAYFRQGVDDGVIPLDVQVLGAMYMQARGDGRAPQLASYILQGDFLLGPRLTPSGAGPYSGLRPYADAAGPRLVWSEGTIAAQLALLRFGLVSPQLTAAVASLAASIEPGAVGPIGADRESDSRWGEYHDWPTSAAASWLLMLANQANVTLLTS